MGKYHDTLINNKNYRNYLIIFIQICLQVITAVLYKISQVEWTVQFSGQPHTDRQIAQWLAA